MADSDIGPAEVALVNEVLRSRALSCGPMIDRFEAEWAERFGSRFAVAVSSGTAGLHLSMIAAGVEDDDLVITSPYSFVASANAVLYQRAVPVFVDIDPLSLNIDPAQVEQALSELAAGGRGARRWLPRRGVSAARPVKAVLPIHVFGRPAAMTPVVRAATVHGARVVEDACEAIGAEHEGRVAGTFGDAAVFGFFPNKPITMGEGGVIATNHEEWAALFRSLRNQGRNADVSSLSYSRLGFNYRLDDMSAALGLAQLRRLDELLEKRARIAAAYTERLGFDGVTPLSPTPGTTRMSWFVYVVRFAPDIDRDAVMRALSDRGIPSRPYFPSIHLQPFYRDRFGFGEGDFPHAEAASRSTLALPFHANLDIEAVDTVADAVRAAITAVRHTPIASAGVSRGIPMAPGLHRGSEAVVTRRVQGGPAPSAPSADAAQAVLVDQFLGRAPLGLPMDDVRALIGGQRVLVTGAGGSIGSELCRQIAACLPASLVMLDRYENGLHSVAQALSGRGFAQSVIGDITDATRLAGIMAEARPDIVLHAAAHKHVTLMEHSPGEAVKNNVTGTRLVVESAIRSGARHFVLISTDKAVRHSGVMGATKRLAELLVQRAGMNAATRCVAVRFGNVIGSNGSVLHTFMAQVQAGGPVTVTHPEARRFFMRIPEAAQFVLHSAACAPAGAIAVLDLGEQRPIVDLARHVIRSLGHTRDTEISIVYTGLRPGENLSEELVADGEVLDPSAVPGVSWVKAARQDWESFDRDVAMLERIAAGEDAATTMEALQRLVGRCAAQAFA
jgi:perosamine synthetase